MRQGRRKNERGTGVYAFINEDSERIFSQRLAINQGLGMKKINVYIVGLMGVGKTTIGKLIAKEFKLPFYDADAEIEKRSGASIPWIFDLEGEAGFRHREYKVIQELTKIPGIVLATGGGAILNLENRRALKKHGVIIYLRASIDELLLRTARNQNRPLLATDNPRQVLEKLLQQREPIYLEVADLIYDTSKHDLTEIISLIKKDVAVISKRLEKK